MEMISEKASKVDLIRSFNNLTLAKTVSGHYPTISQINKEHGVEKTETLLQIIVSDLSASFNGDLSIEDSKEISATINTGILKNMTLEDVYLVCQQIKRTPSYGKLTLNKVMVALDKHIDERLNLIAEKNRNNHLAQKFIEPRKADQEKKKMREAKNWHISKQIKTLNK